MALVDHQRYVQQLVQVASLTPEGLEELTKRLIEPDYPNAHRVRAGGDGGIDVLSDYAVPPARGWQCKNTAKGIPWRDCRESLATAMLSANAPKHYTFVFPRPLTAKERDFWRDGFMSVEAQKYPGLETLDYMDDLAQRIDTRPEIIDDLDDGVLGRYVRSFLKVAADASPQAASISDAADTLAVDPLPLTCAPLSGTRWLQRIDALWLLGKTPAVLVLAEPEGADISDDVHRFTADLRERAGHGGRWHELAGEPAIAVRVVKLGRGGDADVLAALADASMRTIVVVEGNSRAAAEGGCVAVASKLRWTGLPTALGTRHLPRLPDWGDYALIQAVGCEDNPARLLAAMADDLRFGTRGGAADVRLQAQLDRIAAEVPSPRHAVASEGLPAAVLMAWWAMRDHESAAVALASAAEYPVLVRWWLAGTVAAGRGMPSPWTVPRASTAALADIVQVVVAAPREMRPRMEPATAAEWARVTRMTARELTAVWNGERKIAPCSAPAFAEDATTAMRWARAVRAAVWNFTDDGDYAHILDMLDESPAPGIAALGIRPVELSLPIISEFTRALRAELEPLAVVA